MNAYALSRELEKQQARTRKTCAVSLLIHASILMLLLFHRTIMPEPLMLTEISWMEPEPAVPAASAPAPVVKAQRPVWRDQPSPKQEAEHFVRSTEKSDFAPQPQMDRSVKDRLDSKLASLKRTTQRDRPKIAALAASNIGNRPALAAVPERADNRIGAIDMERSDKPAAVPAQLARSEKRLTASQVKLGTISETVVKPAIAAKADSTARRMIDGMSLVGPVADRMLVRYGRPGYPDWAKREGIEGSVDLYFIVMPSGKVKENILVQKTSGFEDFDKNAINALLAWKFEPLGSGRTGEQWGAITFDYRLSD